MKKTYINPTMNVVELHVSNTLLAGSIGYGGDTIETSGNLSREFDEESDFDFNFDSGLEDFE